jgi:hypothetical protein
VRLGCLVLLSGALAYLGLTTLAGWLLGGALLGTAWTWNGLITRSRTRPAPAAPEPALPLPFEPIPPRAYRPASGYSEAHFAFHLRAAFGAAQIFTQCRVPRPAGARGGAGEAWYYPDFVYADATGLRIDIEVDEPYVWASGAPHHCLGQDAARNAYFIRGNWLVVRFSEEQVARYPVACCQLLAALVYQVSGTPYPLRHYRERVPEQPCWDWAAAQQLAAQQSRTSYWADLQPLPAEAEEELVGY